MRVFDAKTMVRIGEVKEILKKQPFGNRRYHLRDTSGGTSRGYSYELVIQEKILKDFSDENGTTVVSEWIWEDVDVIATSKDTSLPEARNKLGGIGAYGPTFDRVDIMYLRNPYEHVSFEDLFGSK